MTKLPPSDPNRPGSMTIAMRAVSPSRAQGAEVVRLGLVREDGRLEERVVPLTAPVVIGPDTCASLVVSDLARSHVLLTRDAAGAISLHLSASMRARVVVEGRARELAGKDETVVLDPRGRGKITIGRTSLLFQLSVAPPKRSRPALPAGVGRGLFAQLDVLFTAFVAFSFLGHFGFVVFLESADWPVSGGLDRVPDRVAELIFEDPTPPDDRTAPPDETDDTDESTDETDDTRVAETRPRTDEARPTREGPSTPTPMSREEASVAMSDAASQVETLLIGTPGANGFVSDALRGGSPLESAEEVMAQVAGGVQIAGVRSELRERDGASGVPGTTDISAMRRIETRTGPREEGRELAETGPRIRTTVPQDDDIEIDGTGEFDQRVVVRMIQTRRAQITACYEHAILNAPSLRGRIAVQMTIEESGSVSRVRTVENGMGSDEVARCIENRIRAFRFSPGPSGGSVDFRFPFVFEQQG